MNIKLEKNDWRGFTQRSEWTELDFCYVDRADLKEAFDLLAPLVPRSEQGHGVELFEDFVRPEMANTLDERIKSNFLFSIIKRLNTSHSRFNPFIDEADFAVRWISYLGFDYEGLRKIFLYWDPCCGEWRQLRSEIALKLIKKRSEIHKRADIEGISKSDRIWHSLYKWRKCEEVRLIFSRNQIDRFTPLWHAIRILYLIDVFKESCLSEIRFGKTIYGGARLSRRQSLQIVCDAARLGLEIGHSSEALDKKQHDKDTLRGRKTLASAAIGGEMRRKEKSPQTEAVFVEMQRLIATGLTAKSAAKIAAKNGIGTSAEANRAIWQRRKARKL